MQVAKAAPSSEHSKVAGVSFAENAKLAEALAERAGGAESIVVSGAVVSGGATIVQSRCAGVASTFPAASMACTRKLCGPMASPVYVDGDEHAAKAAPSSEHWNVAGLSSAENPKVAAVASVVAPGPVSMVVSGTSVSTVQLHVAGDGSTFPAASFAWTLKVWAPSATPTVSGDGHGANGAVSSEHSKVAPDLVRREGEGGRAACRHGRRSGVDRRVRRRHVRRAVDTGAVVRVHASGGRSPV